MGIRADKKSLIKRKERRIISPTKQKVLLLLQAGLALGLTRSPRRQYLILKSIPKELGKINRRYLYQILNEFKSERLVDYRETEDGGIKITLTHKGEYRILEFNIDNLQLTIQKTWDGTWRTVFFDVPETKRRGRDALRHKLQEFGFYEWQKSVFVYPYPCRDEIDFIVEFFELRPHVRYAELADPTNEAELKLHFGLD